MFQDIDSEIDSLAHAKVVENTERLLDFSEMVVIPSRQVACLIFEHPIPLIDDIKVLIQCTGSITDVSSFVWFNTQ